MRVLLPTPEPALQLTPRVGANVEPWPTSANLITPTHSTVLASHNGCRPDTIAMRLQLTPREGANRSRREQIFAIKTSTHAPCGGEL